MYTGDAPTAHTHLLAAGATDVNATAAELNVLDLSATALTTGWGYFANGASTASWRKLLGSEITNDQSWTGAPTTIVGITGTKAQFDTAVTDGNIMYDGDAPTSHALLTHTISGETAGHVLAADSATTFSIRQLLGSEISNTESWAADQTTIVGITGTKAQFDTAVTDGNIMYDGDAPTSHTHGITDLTDLIHTKGITVESPTATEDITMFFTDVAITITQVNSVTRGTTPSVTFNIVHGTSRSATGANLWVADQVLTSVTGAESTSFTDATIVAGSWVWLETQAQSGTVAEASVTIEYTID